MHIVDENDAAAWNCSNWHRYSFRFNIYHSPTVRIPCSATYLRAKPQSDQKGDYGMRMQERGLGICCPEEAFLSEFPMALAFGCVYYSIFLARCLDCHQPHPKGIKQNRRI